MTSKYLNLDFEFNNTSEKDLNLVCCSYSTSDSEHQPRNIWLLNDFDAYEELCGILNDFDREDYIFRAHNVVAEGRAVLSLGLNPEEFQWVDTFAEWRCLTNHNHELQYGEHLIDGKIKTIKPPRPKWMREEGEAMSGKLRHSLSEMVFKLTKKLIDTEHKDEMRKIIISRDDDLILSHKQEIMDYCASDIEHLGVCFRRMVGHYLKLGLNKNTLLSEMLLRGDTMARTAINYSEGY